MQQPVSLRRAGSGFRSFVNADLSQVPADVGERSGSWRIGGAPDTPASHLPLPLAAHEARRDRWPVRCAKPAFVRALISSRSNSASTAKIPNCVWPAGGSGAQ